jgi:hypothetical protein
MTLKERAIIGKEMLAQQKGVTYEEALESIKIRKAKSTTDNTRKGLTNPKLPLDKS